VVYRQRKYVVLLSTMAMASRRIAGQPGVLLRCFASADACLQYLSKHCCDLLTVDLDGLATEGTDVLSKARTLWPWLPRLVLVGAGDVASADVVMRMENTQCLEKPLTERLLLSALQWELSRMESSNFGSLGALTPTELKITHMVVTGRTSKEIASLLKRSKRTIDAHRSRVMHKLGISNVAELVKWAMSKGFYSSDSGGPAQTAT